MIRIHYAYRRTCLRFCVYVCAHTYRGVGTQRTRAPGIALVHNPFFKDGASLKVLDSGGVLIEMVLWEELSPVRMEINGCKQMPVDMELCNAHGEGYCVIALLYDRAKGT